jgi:hypothetical protein
MGIEDDVRRAEEHVVEARRMVHRQKGLIIRLRAAGVNTWMPKRYFGCWNPIYVDLRNAETASIPVPTNNLKQESAADRKRAVAEAPHLR